MAEIQTVNQRKSAEIDKLVRRRGTWIWAGLLGLAGGVAGVLTVGVSQAVGLVFVGGLAGVGIAYWWETMLTSTAFYADYAESRGLVHTSYSRVEGLTSLFRKHDRQREYLNHVLTGPLADDVEGTLAMFTYVFVGKDIHDDEYTKDHPFTMIMVNLPETTAFVPRLVALSKRPITPGVSLDPWDFEPVELESQSLVDRYEIFVEKEQDLTWIFELFPPTFIVWLTEAPRAFAFELDDGRFCAFFPGYRENAAGLDEVIATGCHVVRRLREEVGEEPVPA
jgi:hypothetical protein